MSDSIELWFTVDSEVRALPTWNCGDISFPALTS